MSEQSPLILLVDDEPFNLQILEEILKHSGYKTVSAANGLDAWQLLESSYQKFDAVLLDWMMPKMDGMAVLKRMKAHDEMHKLPVILQTAKAKKHEVVEGLKAGAHHYLIKPYGREQLLAIVKTVVNDYKCQRKLIEETLKKTGSLLLMEQGRFSVRTLEEIYDLAAMLAGTTQKPDKVGLGLTELLVNAFEHGNLGIGYAQKSELNLKNNWENEIVRRMNFPENIDKRVVITYERNEWEIKFFIEDQGEGFEWEQYLELNPTRAFDSHGRGIAMANMLSFDNIEYLGKGNQVIASLLLNVEK